MPQEVWCRNKKCTGLFQLQKQYPADNRGHVRSPASFIRTQCCPASDVKVESKYNSNEVNEYIFQHFFTDRRKITITDEGNSEIPNTAREGKHRALLHLVLRPASGRSFNVTTKAQLSWVDMLKQTEPHRRPYGLMMLTTIMMIMLMTVTIQAGDLWWCRELWWSW